MKGRSNRPQSSDPPPPDEWVDGSWTVDCICGVTFDDGEEMVKCDECDVWVHTRCSRYVKGDDMFTCDKCKIKNNRAGVDSIAEEAEVAQFLVELPTKTISLQNNTNTFRSKVVASRSRRPFKLWTDIPMEERVHFQGIPGGDPSLFAGKSIPSIFGPQLWKCTGYVPKKFNFQYREFPSWGEKEGGKDNDNDDNGAGVLLSFSKETNSNVLATSPVAALVDMRSGRAKRGFKDTGNGKFAGDHVPRFHNAVKKERSFLRPLVVHSSKRRKDDLGGSNSKDRSGKKQLVSTSDREVDLKRKPSHFSKPAFTSTSDAKRLAFYEEGGPEVFKSDTGSLRNKNLKDTVVRNPIFNDSFVVDTIMEEPHNKLTTTEKSSEALYPNTIRHSLSAGAVLAEEKTGHKVVEMSSKTDDAVTSVLKQSDVGNISISLKDGDCLESDDVDGTSVARSTVSPHTQNHCGSSPKVMDNNVSLVLDRNTCPSSAKCKVKVKREEDDNFRLSNIHSSPIGELKSNGKPSDHIPDTDRVNDAAVSSLPSCENKLSDVHISSEVVTDDHTNKPNELPCNFCHGKLEVEVSKGSLEIQKEFSETKDGLDSLKNPSKSEALECSRKMVACVGKSSPTSSTLNSKSPSHDFKSEDTEVPSSFTKHGVITDCNIKIKNESCPSDVALDEIPRKSVRECLKSSLSSNSKVSHSSRSLHSSVSKQINSDVRDSVHLVHQTATVLGSSETDASVHHQNTLQVQSKISSSVPPKVERLNQTNTHLSSKSNQNHLPSVNPSPVSNSSMLSDEELALLLHQELNSSPRVPRIPRARHARSLPQLTSTSATSILMKRTSVGGKDHHLVSRRKNKDAPRDGLGSFREPEDESKRIVKEKGQSSSDQTKQDMSHVKDASVEEGGCASVAAANSITSKVVLATSAIANSCPPSPPEDQNLSSMQNSPRNISDDDTATAGRPVHHTLPGLINDIMSKGRRMTYEELCNAVLPHWHNLRKHNGEHYAYSSHSQAVLDCLRNRHEWARLVDRGPKSQTHSMASENNFSASQGGATPSSMVVNPSSDVSFNLKITEKLTEKNFRNWKQQIEPYICAHDLDSHLFQHDVPDMFLSNADRESATLNPANKTNTNRKRRSKLDTEESDDNGYGKGKTAREEEGKNFELQKEDFPKGKRKARKRRRLALQGRAVKDVRRRQTDSQTDEDVSPFSSSSEESMFSEDEIQVGRCPAGSASDEGSA